MKKKIVLMLLAALFVSATASAGLLLSEDFEDPTAGDSVDVRTYSKKLVPSGWVAASNGYNSNQNGLNNLGDNQAYSFRYTNSGLTSAVGEIGVLEAGTTYTVTFDVAMDTYEVAIKENGVIIGYEDAQGLAYEVQLAAFEADVPRNDARGSFIEGGNAVVLATTNVDLNELELAPEDGSWATITLEFTADAVDNAASIGKDIGIRILGATSSANVDNVTVTSAAVPEPATLVLLGIGGLLLRRRS